MLQKYIKNPLWGKTETTSLPKDYVLIIGESARKDYFHIYGYPVPNTAISRQDQFDCGKWNEVSWYLHHCIPHENVNASK